MTDPSAVKVVIDPITIPLDIVETNVNVIVYKPENTTLKNFNPEEVKVTRVTEVLTTPAEDPEPSEEDADNADDDGNGE